MTRTYALKRLLEHGGLTRAEIIAITGWPGPTVKAAIDRSLEYGVIVSRRMGYRAVYELAP